MGIGTSLILITVGAIMRFAVTAQGNGFNIQTIGLILMIVGLVGFVISLVYWNSWGGFGHRPLGGGRTVVTRTEHGVPMTGVPPNGVVVPPPGYGAPPQPGVYYPAAPAAPGPRQTTVVEEEDF